MTDLPEVKLKALVNFPAAVHGGTAVAIDKDGSTYTIGTDFSEVQEVSNVTAEDVPVTRLLLWNKLTNSYSVAPFALAVTAGVASIDGNTGALDIGDGIEFVGSTLSLVRATQAEAIAGTVNTAWMTPLRTRQAHDAYEVSASLLTSFASGVLGSGDDTATMLAFLNAWKNASAGEIDALLTHGTYRVTSLPNFLNPGSRFEGRGRPEIRYSGTDVISNFFDISDDAQPRPHQSIKNLVLRGTANVQTVLHINNVNHSLIENVQLFDCNPGYPAFQSESWVCGVLRNLIVSGASGYGGFTPGAVPRGGVIFGSGTGGDSASQTIACLVENPIIEHVGGFGLSYQNGSYLTLLGGTSESNDGGQSIAAGSNHNLTINLFCEYNAGFFDPDTGLPNPTIGTDINDAGAFNSWYGGEFVSATNAGLLKGRSAYIQGARVRDLTIDAAARGTVLVGVEVIGTFTDSAPDTTRIGCFYENAGSYTAIPNKFPTPTTVPLSLNGGWSAEASHIGPCYSVTAEGWLHFEGGLNANAVGVMSTLPSDQRPATTRVYRLRNDSNALVKITILADGTINQSGAVSDKYSLYGVSFRVGT